MDKEVLDHVIFIREKLSSIDEHLHTLNSKVAKNVVNIERNRQYSDERQKEIDNRIDAIKLTLTKWGAIATLIISVVATAVPIFVTWLLG